MTLLRGNSESRTVYRNFELLNLHVNLSDRSHKLYNNYLCYNRFLPPDESRYFAHLTTNTLAPAPGSTELQKGSFNVFPVNLATEELSKSSTSSLGKVFLGGGIRSSPANFFLSAGVVNTSPLKLELQFEPVPQLQWFLLQAYTYMCRIDFTGSKTNQEILFGYL